MTQFPINLQNNFLEEVMKEIVTEVNKKVRDGILLGKAKMSKVRIYFI